MDEVEKKLRKRLKEVFGDVDEIKIGICVIMNLRNIKGLCHVDEVENIFSSPYPIVIINNERRYDISIKQYLMGRIRYLESLIKRGKANE